MVVAVTSDSASDPDSFSSGSGPGVCVCVGCATIVLRRLLRCCLSSTFLLACSSAKESSCSKSGSIPAIRLLRLIDWDPNVLDSAVVAVS